MLKVDAPTRVIQPVFPGLKDTISSLNTDPQVATCAQFCSSEEKGDYARPEESPFLTATICMLRVTSQAKSIHYLLVTTHRILHLSCVIDDIRNAR